MRNQLTKFFNKTTLLCVALLTSSTGLLAGPPPPPSGVPIDDGLPYLLVGVILAGVYKIRKNRKSKNS